MQKATLLNAADGSAVTVYPQCVDEFTERELMGMVSGCLEMVDIDDNRFMYVNENGDYLDLPLNEEATKLCGTTIQGNAVVMNKER